MEKRSDICTRFTLKQMELRQAVEVDMQSIDSVLTALSTIQHSHSHIKHNLSKHTDSTNMVYFDRIDKSISTIRAIVGGMRQDKSSAKISKPSAPISKVSLLKVFQSSVPRKLPKDIEVKLPLHDVEIEGYLYKLIVLFSNLLENSVHALGRSGVITINLNDLVDSVLIQVHDTGPGIPETIMNRMFSTLSTTKENGTGLGTKMAKSIVDLHHGTISVHNNPTTFTIRLPKTQT